MISIIIPVYNVSNYLEECLESVLNQTYSDIEILLIDDGSTDDSGKICDKWAKKDVRIRVFHKNNGGLSSSRNFGLDNAKGDYISFVDSDDIISKDMIMRLFNLINNTNSSISACPIKTFYNNEIESSKPFYYQKPDCLKFSDYLRKILEHKIENACCNKIFRRNIIGQARFKEGIINEDVLFMVNILQQNGTICYGELGVYYYRIRFGSITQQANPKIFQYISNALEIRKILPSNFAKICDAYINYECVNLISTVIKFDEESKFKRELDYCHSKIRSNLLFNMLNSHWPIGHKIKYFLVAYFPFIYKFLLKKFK